MIGEKIIKIMSEIEPIEKTEVDDENKDCIEVEIPGSGFDEKGRAVYAALTRSI